MGLGCDIRADSIVGESGVQTQLHPKVTREAARERGVLRLSAGHD